MSEPTFQLLPPLPEEQYAALKESIRERGLLEPILVDTDGTIIDGHHRDRAIRELQAEGFAVLGELQHRSISAGESDEEKRAHVYQKNLNRRQLTQPQMAAVIRAEIARDSDRPDRQIARVLGVSPSTVGAYREMSTTVQSGHRYRWEEEHRLIDAELKKDPHQSHSVIADLLGVRRQRVERRRVTLELSGEIPRVTHMIDAQGRRHPHTRKLVDHPKRRPGKKKIQPENLDRKPRQIRAAGYYLPPPDGQPREDGPYAQHELEVPNEAIRQVMRSRERMAEWIIRAFGPDGARLAAQDLLRMAQETEEKAAECRRRAREQEAAA